MRKTLLLVALLTATGGLGAKPADPTSGSVVLKPTEQQAQAATWAARFLTRFHYKAVALDDAMSEKIFDTYFQNLDSDRLFFLQTDLDKFASSRTTLDDAILNKDLSVPFAIFNLYEQRVAERTAYSRELLKKGFDFTADESYNYDRDKTPWAKGTAELDEVWRKRVKNDWLRLKLANKKDDEIRKTLDKRYANYADRVHQINGEDAFQTFMNAYATAIEPHTNYLSPRASENFDIAMRLSLEGIGAVLQRDEEYTAIREIVPGGPAELSGKLKVGDRIVGVGQGASGTVTDVIGWRLDDVVDLIRGQKDTMVRLEVLPADKGPDGKHDMLALTRKKVSIEGQAAKKSVIDVPDGDVTRRIGVISLPTFYQDFDARRRGDKDYKSATRDVSRLLTELKADKIDGVVVDLRNNGGGSLSEATELTGLFIDQGPVVQVRNAQGKVEEERDTQAGMAWDGPMAVMVNRGSASASEIFAAAIQDYGRGLIVGEPTFGKGTVQNLVDLDEVTQQEKPVFGELKMTIAQFFRANGGSTQLRGVSPDINFPANGDAKEFGESTYDNALPWTSIPAAEGFAPVADLKPVVPLLITRHDARVEKEKEWQYLSEDLAEYRKLREEKTVSLSEDTRRKERDSQEARRKARELADASSTVSPTEMKGVPSKDQKGSVAADAKNKDSTGDDGLQADERGISSELEREKEAKSKKDVALQEAAHILADEVALIRGDTKLAQQVLPHAAHAVD
jgi:carboxyl-terminal processing protease